jgi:hypothetical protein
MPIRRIQWNTMQNKETATMKRTTEMIEQVAPSLPEGASVFSRKVARSGHISYEGRPYFISKALAGHYIRLVVLEDRLIVDAAIPLHKEYPLV